MRIQSFSPSRVAECQEIVVGTSEKGEEGAFDLVGFFFFFFFFYVSGGARVGEVFGWMF